MRAQIETANRTAAEAKAALESIQKEREALLHEKEIAGKSEAEKLKIEQDRLTRHHAAETKRLSDESAANAAVAKRATEELQTFRISTVVTQALVAGKALSSALGQASQLFMAETRARFEPDPTDATGAKQRLVMDVGELTFDDPAKAASEWLKRNPHFVSYPGGGNGTVQTRGGGAPGESGLVVRGAALGERPR